MKKVIQVDFTRPKNDPETKALVLKELRQLVEDVEKEDHVVGMVCNIISKPPGKGKTSYDQVWQYSTATAASVNTALQSTAALLADFGLRQKIGAEAASKVSADVLMLVGFQMSIEHALGYKTIRPEAVRRFVDSLIRLIDKPSEPDDSDTVH